MRIVTITPLFFLGFSSTRLVSIAVLILAFYPIFIHANIRWDYGPLRWLIASPAFHRWHHTAEAAGINRNFAGLFPFIDLVFGTFHLPRRPSSAYGLGFGQHMPTHIGIQLVHPFLRGSPRLQQSVVSGVESGVHRW